ncbi:MAG: AAA family ATPase [Deltaproteobacteria bacterium]|nr:AAA family ATPase [Deltaproteobacteria bacterium]
MPAIPIASLPTTVDTRKVIEPCHGRDLDEIADALRNRQSVLVECDKLLAGELFMALRPRFPQSCGIALLSVDHRRDEGDGAINATLKEFRRVVRDGDAQTAVVVVPNFDLMVSADQTGQHVDLTTREVLATLYENPGLCLLAFKDPNLSVPKAILEFFSRRIDIVGVDRRHLPHLVTQTEARRFDLETFDPYALYKYVSGLNVVKLRQVLSGLAGDAFADQSPHKARAFLRRATLDASDADLPSTRLDDIGGYERVKELLRKNVLDVLAAIEGASATRSEAELAHMERLVPRSILFTGPPGTGKTMFCKALAAELDATVIVINGPELKSKWVGESEERIRKIFSRARRSTPAIVVFDEIDSFAGKRGGASADGEPRHGTGTSSDHSMLNQLLTEMDGFRSHESVFVIATTNFATNLDEALRSRMRYEIEIPYPDRADREAIVRVYDRKYGLALEPAVMRRLLDETETWIDPATFSRFAGRDLEALAAALARARLLAAAESRTAVEATPITEEMVALLVAERIRAQSPLLSFADIGGYDEAKEKLRTEILDTLALAQKSPPDKQRQVERMVPKGVIFEGPPGTGKTMFAKALARELRATVSIVNGPELKSMWHGESERRVREIFAEARRNAPSVIVFDEIDSIAGAREGAIFGVDRSMVNQLLTEMDGFHGGEMVFVVATTNFASSLDQALRRPGRFEYVLNIGYPDEDARAAILSLYNRKYELGLDEKLVDHLIFRTSGWVDPASGTRYSGDHLEAICRALFRRRLREPERALTIDDLDQAVAQRTKKPLKVTAGEEEVIAVHEAGHAVVARHVEGAMPVRKISIASEYDGSLGYVLHGEPEQRYVQDERQLRAQIVCLMGGRMAERLVLGRVASGGANDIEKATLIATHLVAEFGMDKEVGPRTVMHPMVHGKSAVGGASPELLATVERRVGLMLSEAEAEAERLLTVHRAELDELKRELLAKKVVEFRDVEKIKL